MNQILRYNISNTTTHHASVNTTHVFKTDNHSFSTTTKGMQDSHFIEKLPQCDYSQLFSHLPLSFQFIQMQHFQSASAQSQHHSSTTPDSQAQYQQQSAYKLCFALVSLLFGLFYSLIGYRFLKLSTFFIGFAMGSSIIYLILSEQKQLSLVENLIISLSIGVLFAFVALLVQFIGLFLLGIVSSTSIVTCILILIDLFYTNKSAWLCIGLLFVCATILASFSLKFQKSLTILNTSCIGCGLLLISIDFFVENNLLIDYIIELYKVNGNSFNVFERQKALLKSSSDFMSTTTASTLSTSSILPSRTMTTTTSTSRFLASSSVLSNFNATGSSNSTLTSSGTSGSTGNSALALFLHLYSSAHARLCWYTWLIFGTYFLLLIVSLLIQFLLTGRNYDHRDSWHKLIKGSRKKKSANLEKIRLKSHLNETANNNSHHHHSHHHHHHETGTISTTNNGLMSSESSLSRNSDLESSSQNDTLLLVESKRLNTQNYIVNATSEREPTGQGRSHHKSRSKQSRRHNHHNQSKNEPATSSLDIVPFEAFNQKKKEKASSKSKSKSSSDKTPSGLALTSIEKIQVEKTKTAAPQTKNTLTTTSTTSTGSSASSTCQLIPLKLNGDIATTVLEDLASIRGLNPSAPPCPQMSPPPIPTLPPPKLPPHTIKTNTLNATSNLMINPMAGISKNLSKIKQNNRMSGKDSGKDVSSNDKFRHFYQIRRNNGDVLSQDFINNIQNKLSSSNNLNNSSTNLNPTTTAENSTTRSSSLNSSEKKNKKKSTSKK